MRDAPKLLILAIDGADYYYVRHGIETGLLPALRNIAQIGAWGPLRSTIPPFTAMAWPSIFTGVNPGKHGIFNFLNFPAGNCSPRPVFMDKCQVPTLWALLNQAGYRVGVWRLPWGYPAEKVDGYMLCDRSPDAVTGITWPDALVSEIRNRFHNYQSWTGTEIRRAGTSLQALLTAFLEELRREGELLQFCMTNWPTDVVLCGFSLLDHLGHRLEGHGRDVMKTISEAYKHTDRWVGQILERWVGPDTTVCVISDHGQGPTSIIVNVLRLLVDRGYLSFENVPYRRSLFAARVAARGYLWLESRGGLKVSVKKVSHRLASAAAGPRFASRVVWSDSTIIPWGWEGSLWLNQREKTEKECQEASRGLREELLRLRDPQTGRGLIEAVFPKEELYWGSHVADGPDVVIVPCDGVGLVTGIGAFPKDRHTIRAPQEVKWNTALLVAPLVYKRWGWTHRPRGVFMVSGPGIAAGALIRNATVFDVSPTILYALEVPIPTSMDGWPHLEAFQAKRLASVPVSFTTNMPVSEFTAPTEDPDHAEAITERLRELGYL